MFRKRGGIGWLGANFVRPQPPPASIRGGMDRDPKSGDIGYEPESFAVAQHYRTNVTTIRGKIDEQRKHTVAAQPSFDVDG